MSAPAPRNGQPQSWLAIFTSQPYLLLTLAPMLWAGNFVIGQLAVGHIDASVLVVGRWAGASAILLTFALPHLKRDWPKIRPRLGMFAVYGALGFTTFNALIYYGSHLTSATNISIEQAGIPIFVMIGNFLVFRVKASWLQVVGLVLTILGVVWVATHGAPQRILFLDLNIGDAMVILAALAYAIYSLVLRYKPDVHWLSFILVAALFALLTALIFQMLFGGGYGKFFAEIPQITTQGWLCVLYVMLFPSIIAQLCFARGVELVGPNRAAIFVNLLPIFGTIMSIVLLGEQFFTYHLIALILVFIGIFLSEYSVRRAP